MDEYELSIPQLGYRYLLVKFSEEQLKDLNEWATEHNRKLSELAQQTLLDAAVG